MRESIRERRTFARIAPRFVAPLPFAMPTGSSLTRNPMAMKAALALDAFVGRDRNDGVDPERHLPWATSLPARHVVSCSTALSGRCRQQPCGTTIKPSTASA